MRLTKLTSLLFASMSLLTACQNSVVSNNVAPARTDEIKVKPTTPVASQQKPPANTSFQQLKLEQALSAQIYSLGCGIGCPIYTIKIHSDFSATYKGIAFVRDTNEHNFLMTEKARKGWLGILGELKQQTRYVSGVSDCSNYKTDSLRYRIVIQQQGKTFDQIIDKGCHSSTSVKFENYFNGLVSRWLSRRSGSHIK